MTAPSVRSTVEIGTQQVTPPSLGSGATMTLQFLGKAYNVTLFRKEADGRETPLSPYVDPATLEKAKQLVKKLFEAHEIQAKKMATVPTDEPTEMNAQGLVLKNRTLLSHDFDIDQAELVQQLFSQLSPSGTSAAPASIKGTEVWNSIDTLIKDKWVAQSQPATSSQPTPPSPTQSSTSSSAPQSHPSAPSAPHLTPYAPKTSSSLALEGHDFTQADWFEKIPSPRMKRTILRNLSKFTMPEGSPEKRHWDELVAKGGDPMATIARQLAAVEPLCEAMPSAIDAQIRTLAQQILTTSQRPAWVPKAIKRRDEEEVQPLITSLMTQEFTHKDQLLQLFLKQAQAENLARSDATLDWAKANFAAEHKVFIRALTLWLDTL